MSQLANIVKTMSSVELAKLTGKKHDNVLRDIKNMLRVLNIDLLKFEENEKYANNRTRKVYNLPKRECLILVSGYSIELRAV